MAIWKTQIKYEIEVSNVYNVRVFLLLFLHFVSSKLVDIFHFANFFVCLFRWRVFYIVARYTAHLQHFTIVEKKRESKK